MFTTLELRWFYRGTLPAEIKDWFAEDGLGQHLGGLEEREDTYLYIPECEDLGVKLRQGKLEIKWRKTDLGVLCLRDNLAGKTEKWMKWTCEEAAAESLNPDRFMQRKPWIVVKKVRSQRHYQVSTDTTAAPLSVPKVVDQGCSVEITQLTVQGSDWWSLGFEASGDDHRLKTNLLSVVTYIFKSYRGPKLQAQDSYAYPHWLFLIAE